MVDTQLLLSYRLAISVIICAIFLAGAVASLFQIIFRGRNGVYPAISLVSFITAALFGVFIFISYVDVCNPDNAIIRDWALLAWDIVITLLPISFAILGVQLVRSD